MSAERKSYLFGTETIACIRTWRTNDSEIIAAVRADGGRHTVTRGVRIRSIRHEPVSEWETHLKGKVRVTARYICRDCGQKGTWFLGWTHDELAPGHIYPEPFEEEPIESIVKRLVKRDSEKFDYQLSLEDVA